MMDTVKNWFSALSRREQILLGIAGGLLLFIIVIFGIVRPLWAGSFAAERSFQETAYKAAQLDARHSILKSAPQRSAAPAGNVMQRLTEEAAGRGITLDSNDASGADGAVIAIASVNPNSFLRWALALEEKGIIITQLSMRPVSEGANATALVSVRAGFSRISPN